MNPVVHFEMPYENPKRISDFYAKAFGWKMQSFGEGGYVVATTTESGADGRGRRRFRRSSASRCRAASGRCAWPAP